MALPKPTACAGCPLEGVGRGYVPGEGPTTARVALVGQGPGEMEYTFGRPFIGPSGRELEGWLARAGLARSDAYVDNVIRCWPPKNREPSAKERRACWERHLHRALAAMPNLELVVAVGVPAQDPFIPTEVRGERAVGGAYTYQLEDPCDA